MAIVKVKVWDIDWDTDGEVIEDLPANITLELEDLDGLGVSDEDVADELSDRYGFCVNSFYCDKYDENGALVDEFGNKINEIEDKVS